MRAVAKIVMFALFVGCSAEQPHGRERGLEIRVAPLDLPGVGDACFDLRVTNGSRGAGEVVWARGTPGLNGGTPDTGAVCSRRYGNGTGDITWVGSCDASGQLDDDPQGERMNSVTLWFDALYDRGGAYIAPDGPGGWRDPCPEGCTLDVLCEENADTGVTFDFTLMRNGGQGFFDVAVSFDDIFCSAKLDTCYEDGSAMKLLFGADDTRDWTAVFGFACTAGHGDAKTTLHYGDLAVVCTAGATTTVFPLNPVGNPGNNRVTTGEHTLHYGLYRGAEALSCDDPSTVAVERCNKVYWNLAVSLDDLASLGSCTFAFAATATDDGRGFANGLLSGAGVAYPFIEVGATLTPPSCQRHALDDGGVVRTAYRGDLASAPTVMCTAFDGVQAGPIPGADCSDACPNDPDKTRPGICGCGMADTDTDGDGVADCVDACPADPDKAAAGVCGCGVADTDTDGDGVADCADLCDTDPDKTEPGICGCGVSDSDSDNDGSADCVDACPNDNGKTEPGICGCGVSDSDSDNDGSADCVDACPNDNGKTEPGICGCGVSDSDSDNDGSADCVDACPNDNGKTEPGICGCGVSDSDSDNDGSADCVDGCPVDPDKVAPGSCGCGVTDVAADRLGGSQANAASSCVAIHESGETCGNGRYWIDPTGGSTADAFEAYCDMENGGWMKVESAAWPFMFSDANWTNHNAATPDVANYSILGKRTAFIDSSGCYTFRLRLGESGNWQSAPTHETVWRQCHDPFTQTTNGSDYTYIAGQQPATCGGFNGLHHKYQGNSKTSDPDLNDAISCWWMQVVPTQQYGTAANFPGYLDGYGGTGNTHVWQSLWVKAAGTGLGREAPAPNCVSLRDEGHDHGTYWLDPDGGENGDAFRAYCDMTEGWARLIGVSTTLADLAALPVTSNTITSFVSDATYGLSWGTFTTVSSWSEEPHHLQLDLRFDQLKVTHSGWYHSPVNGLGLMIIRSNVGQIIHSSDAHAEANNGQSLLVGGTSVFSSSMTNIVNRTDTVTATGSTMLKISLNAYTSSYAYTRRYIRELWFR